MPKKKETFESWCKKIQKSLKKIQDLLDEEEDKQNITVIIDGQPYICKKI